MNRIRYSACGLLLLLTTGGCEYFHGKPYEIEPPSHWLAGWRGRSQVNAQMGERSLDLTAVRHADSFEWRFGSVQYAEYAVETGTTWKDIAQTVEAMLPPDAERSDELAITDPHVEGALWAWSKQRFMILLLEDPDPGRNDEPAFVLIYQTTE